MMLLEDQIIEEYKVKVKIEKEQKEDGSKGEKEGEEICVCYKIRGLKNDEEEEILKWSKFCASVFAYKANPPPASYFERHYINDPFNKDTPSLIRVATIKNQQQQEEEIIVASCRLFLRTISSPAAAGGGGGGGGCTTTTTNNNNKFSFLSAGGIGEVCTDPKHRRRGLSKILLQNCISIMKERQLQLSLLHAAPTFFDVYEKTGGYKCTKSCWSTIEINYKNLLLSSSSSIMIKGGGGGGEGEEETYYSIRQAKFPNDSETLLKLHQRYSEQRFAGCIVRNIDYWNNYLSQELGDTLLVLCYEEKIVGWLSIRPRGENRIQLREFGLDENNNHQMIDTAKVLTILLSSAMNQIMQNNNNTHEKKEENFVLSLPTFVINQVRRRRGDGGEEEEKDIDHQKAQRCFLWSTLKSDDDMGWMYKILDEQVVDFNMIDGTNTPHLIWPSDSF